MSLSNEINDKAVIYPSQDFIYKEDVKDFIKELKEEFREKQLDNHKFSSYTDNLLFSDVGEIIDKLAGDKLV